MNFRASLHAGTEKIYGCHVMPGDTVGVMLDCDAGRVSFFVDGLKYGEHVLSDLGVAFQRCSPFGYEAEGKTSTT